MILHHKGMDGTFEYSEEDKCYHGKLLGIDDLVTYESDDFYQLEKEFISAIYDYWETRDKL